jgi:hypothetical protein
MLSSYDPKTLSKDENLTAESSVRHGGSTDSGSTFINHRPPYRLSEPLRERQFKGSKELASELTRKKGK